MEPSSYTSYSSSSSQFISYAQEEERAKTTPYFRSSLHTVRKLPAKPMKKPIAPLPPIKPKVYKVEPEDFKKVVQKLTAAPEFQRSRLEEMAPPALDLSATTLSLDLSASMLAPEYDVVAKRRKLLCSPWNTQTSATFLERKTHKISETCGALSPLGFSFSPSSLAWTFSPLLSPGTMSLVGAKHSSLVRLIS